MIKSPPLSHVLLVGASGTGKTTYAQTLVGEGQVIVISPKESLDDWGGRLGIPVVWGQHSPVSVAMRSIVLGKSLVYAPVLRGFKDRTKHL